MVTGLQEAIQSESWQFSLKNGFNDNHSLLKYLNIQHDPKHKLHHRPFPMRVSRSFADRMQPGDQHDPLLKQVLICSEEWEQAPGFSIDPLAENTEQQTIKGLLHKYPSRVLLLPTGSCAIHCRYCFRRHFPYETHRLTGEDWQNILDYIAKHPEINEVIFSGGDPLMLPDPILEKRIKQLETLSQLRYLRFHTRLPIVLPNRITAELLQMLQETRFNTSIVIHCNHPNELNKTVQTSLLALRAASITLLNQAVLLKSINDSASCLAELSYRLFDAGVLPYYLHQLDKVMGTHHFEVSLEQGKQLISELREKVPGYLMPQWVVEEPFRKSKQPAGI